MEKNQELIGTVIGMGSNGEGVIKLDNRIIFVPFTLMGEKVRFKVLKVASKCVYGKAVEILTPAEERIRAKCPVFSKCGGCQLQHIKYVNQLKIKEEAVAVTFRKVANLNVSVKSTVRGDNEFRYRNKLQLPVCYTKNGTEIGFFAENSHRVIAINDCLINAPWTANIISSFKQYIDKCGVIGYDEASGIGDIREITAKEVKGNLIITVVTVGTELKQKDTLIEILNDNLKYPFSLYQNVNDKNTNVIYGEKFILHYGPESYTAEMFGVKYKIGVQSFMQVNTSVCSKLYSTVRELACADDDTVVIDAYSGAGLMTALLAKDAKSVIGIEIIPEAVECANDLMAINKLDHKVKNILGKCEVILPDIIRKEKQNGSKIAIVLDPPRKGCEYAVIDSIIKSRIDKIVYVSCKPSTLARDIGLLVGTLEMVDGQVVKAKDPKNRYEIDYVRTFDMFAQTKHIETVVCLKKI